MSIPLLMFILLITVVISMIFSVAGLITGYEIIFESCVLMVLIFLTKWFMAHDDDI